MVQNAGLGVGALLKSRREELGQDRESVSKQLRIRSLYIRAIEEGRMQDLPGNTYAVGFVRTYADFLGFDGNSVVDNFREEIGQRGRPEPLAWQMEDKDGGFPFGKLLVILLVVAAAAYGVWYYLANTQSGTDLIEAVPEYLKKNTGSDKVATPASGATTAQPSSVPAGSSGSAAPSGTAPAQPDATTTGQNAAGNAAGSAPTTPDASAPATTGAAPSASEPAAASAQSTPAAAATTPSPGQATTTQGTATQATTTVPAGAAAQPAPNQTTATASQNSEASPDVTAAATTTATRITVKAKLESWVQINDKDGKPVLSRVLRAGESYAVPDQKGLVMDTGNAGGIEVMVDGKTMPTLGSVGLVKRNIVLDPDKLASGELNAKAPAKAEPADGNGGATTTGD